MNINLLYTNVFPMRIGFVSLFMSHTIFF